MVFVDEREREGNWWRGLMGRSDRKLLESLEDLLEKVGLNHRNIGYLDKVSVVQWTSRSRRS